MKKISVAIICFLLVLNTKAQKNDNNYAITAYWGIEIAGYMHLNIPDIAVTFGLQRPSTFAPLISVGYQAEFSRCRFSLGGEVGGLFNTTINSLVAGCNLFGGYRLNNSIAVGISCGMQAYHCYAVLDGSASMNMGNGSITEKPTVWDLSNLQKLTLGPRIEYSVDNITFMIGADFGMLPAKYRSILYNINDNEETTFHRLYVGYQIIL